MLKRITQKIVVSVSMVISGTAASYIYLGSWLYASLIGLACLIGLLVLLSYHKEKDDRLRKARSKIHAAGYESTVEFLKKSSAAEISTKPSAPPPNTSAHQIPSDTQTALNLLDIEYTRNTSLSCVKRAYHKKVRAYHPDLETTISQEKATKHISELKAAKRLCMDFIQRSENV